MTVSIGFGSALSVGTSTGTLAIAKIMNISGPDSSATEIETTTFDSTSRYETYVCGTIDPGSLQFDLVYSTTETSHKRLAEYFKAGAAKTWTVTYSSTTMGTDAMSGFVSGLSKELPLKDKMTCQVSIKLTGDPAWST